MSTVDKQTADKVIAGNGTYPGDEYLPPYVRIIEYNNAWGGVSYGLEDARTLGRFKASPFIRNPRVYWERKQ